MASADDDAVAAIIAEDVLFIKEDLLPEMVQNRCFCEANSREFVELDSVEVEPAIGSYQQLQPGQSFYHALVTVRFSDLPESFRVLVKLLPADVDPDSRAYAGFLNEEILYNKAVLHYSRHLFPRLFVADMGRYGRPVICLEDLERLGYQRPPASRLLSFDEAKLALELAARFHARGLRLRRDDFPAFRELYAKLQETSSRFFKRDRPSQLDQLDQPNNTAGVVVDLNAASRSELERVFIDKESTLACFASATICIGAFVPANLWFKRRSDDKDESLAATATAAEDEVRVLDWQKARLGPVCLDVSSILRSCQPGDSAKLREAYLRIVAEQLPELSKPADVFAGEQQALGFLYEADEELVK